MIEFVVQLKSDSTVIFLPYHLVGSAFSWDVDLMLILNIFFFSNYFISSFFYKFILFYLFLAAFGLRCRARGFL